MLMLDAAADAAARYAAAATIRYAIDAAAVRHATLRCASAPDAARYYGYTLRRRHYCHC